MLLVDLEASQPNNNIVVTTPAPADDQVRILRFYILCRANSPDRRFYLMMMMMLKPHRSFLVGCYLLQMMMYIGIGVGVGVVLVIVVIIVVVVVKKNQDPFSGTKTAAGGTFGNNPKQRPSTYLQVCNNTFFLSSSACFSCARVTW